MMKQRRQFIPIACMVSALLAGLCGCSDSDPGENGVPERTLDQERFGWGEVSSVEYLQRALAWASGKTPEALVTELAAEDFGLDDEGLSWRYYVTLAAFMETYGAAGAERAAAAFRDAFLKARSVPRTGTRHYPGKLGGDYPDIYEIALEDPERALSELDSILVHPNELEKLRSEVIAAYGQARPAEALALLDELTNIVSYPPRKSIVLTWAKDDPEAALEYVDALNEERSMLGLRHELLLDMVRYAPLRALEAAVDSPINRETDYTLQKVAEAYVQAEPEKGFEWLMAQETLSHSLLKAGVDGLISGHPDLAEALMRSVDPDRWQAHFVRNLAVSRVTHGVAGAMAWAGELPGPEHRSNAYAGVFSVLAKDHPDQLLANLGSVQSLGISMRQYSKIAETFAAHHPEKAFNWAVSAPDSPAAAFIFGKAGRRLLNENPGRIGEVLAVVESGGFKSAVIDEIVRGWIDGDPGRAIAWVRNEADPSALDQIVPAIAAKWFGSDSNSALDFATGLPPGKARTALLGRYVGREAERNLEAVVRTLGSVEADSGVHGLMRKAFETGGEVRPQKAKALIPSIQNPDSRDGAIQGVIRALINIDPTETAAWIEEVEFAGEKNMEYSLRYAVDQWARRDRAAATDWALGLTDEAKRHHASLRLVGEVEEGDTARASRLLNSARPGESRVNATIRVLRQLPEGNAREAFVASVFLTKDEQQKLQEQRGKQGL